MASEPFVLQPGRLTLAELRRIERDGVALALAPECRDAIERGRAARPDLKLGICGEHGGDPASVAFCHRIGLDYVSCSPYRVPIARLAAAQAAIGAVDAGSTD